QGSFDLYQVTFKSDAATDSVALPAEEPLLAQTDSVLQVDESTGTTSANVKGNLLTLEGMVIDAATQKPVIATITVTDMQQGKEVATITSDSAGIYAIHVAPNSNYALAFSANGYLFYSENISLADTEPLHKEVPLRKAVVGAQVVLRNVFFETGKTVFNDQSVTELERLYQLLKANRNIRIEIAGHTDNTGPADINQRLSEERASAVVQYLTQRGINQERLQAKGYGYAKPVADNSTEEGRKRNRRTEFSIIEILGEGQQN
ncbi:MAG: OmpA family protein, partial [Hymenobacteraceae bacterium]|nr:OmpA family protein [Hymenobacteraceae bacterium]MDX5394835.1 OmpA family protein [Hymenobacteraceae bacterium]MDX5443337.1 OmpA family protein [Hymenobacteraceae bacterium]MDX5510869.1 OmpA family protein [Hymenobacteraceae bacterium]